MTERKRLYLVADRDVTTPWAGGSIRDRGLCERLAEDWDVTYVILARDGTRSEGEFRPGFRWISLPLSRLHRTVHALLSARRLDLSLTYEPLLYLSPSCVRSLRDLLREAPLIGTVYPYLFPACRRLAGGKPLIYWSHNCEGDLAEVWTCAAPKFLGGPVRRLIYRAERQAVHGSRMVVACSQGDVDAMKGRYGDSPSMKAVIPNGVDTKTVFAPTAEEKREAKASLGIEQPMAVFVASASWEPNGQASRFVLNEISPNAPEILFCLAGTIGLDLAGDRPSRTVSPSSFLRGWYPPEHWKGKGAVRWMGQEACLGLPQEGGSLRFEAAAPSSLTAVRLRRFLPFLPWNDRRIEIHSENGLLGRYRVPRGSFVPIEVEVPPGAGRLTLRALDVEEPRAAEPRQLGVATSKFLWRSPQGQERSLELEALHTIPGAPDNVVITGWVSDEFKRRVLHAADLAVNPMLSGSGSNLKMLEFMASGLPVVTTPCGARGIDLRDGVDAVIVDAENMAGAVKTLLDSEELMGRLGREAAAKARSSYSWEVLANDLRQRLDALNGSQDREAS